MTGDATEVEILPHFTRVSCEVELDTQVGAERDDRQGPFLIECDRYLLRTETSLIGWSKREKVEKLLRQRAPGLQGDTMLPCQRVRSLRQLRQMVFSPKYHVSDRDQEQIL